MSAESYLGTLERMSPAKNSLPNSLSFLSSALQRLGITDKLNLQSSDPDDVVETCNAIYHLLLQHEKDTEYKNQLKSELLASRQSVQQARRERSRLETTLETKEREIQILAQKARSRDETWKEEATRARREADDLQKRLLGSDRKIVQMRHEIKRKEKEYEKLQQKLSHHLVDNRKGEMTALDMAATQVTKGKATSMRPVRQEDGTKTIIAAFESKEVEYRKEIASLKGALSTLEDEHAKALNAMAQRRQDTSKVVRIVDDSFLQAVPHMSANELVSELTTKIKALQKRLNSLDWHASQMGTEDGIVSIRERRLCDDLAAARIVLHDQEALITGVLIALRAALSDTEAKYETKVKDLTVKYETMVASLKQKMDAAEAAHQDKLSSGLKDAREEFEAVLQQQKTEKEELVERCSILERKVQELVSSEEASVETAVREMKAQHAVELEKARNEVEASMAEMAAHSSEIQLALKREHASLRAETCALREILLAERQEKEKIETSSEALISASVKEALEAAKEEESSRISHLLLEKEEEVRRIQRAHEEQVSILESEKLDLTKSCQQFESQLKSSRIELEKQIHQHQLEIKKIQEEAEQSIASKLADSLEKNEQHFSAEKEEIEKQVAHLSDKVKSLEGLVTQKDSMLQSARVKEMKADAMMSQYGEMTEYYKDLMSKYAPGLGAGTFLEKAVQRKAGACLRD